VQKCNTSSFLPVLVLLVIERPSWVSSRLFFLVITTLETSQTKSRANQKGENKNKNKIKNKNQNKNQNKPK